MNTINTINLANSVVDTAKCDYIVFQKLLAHDGLNTFLWWEGFPSQLSYNTKEFQLVHYSEGSLPMLMPPFLKTPSAPPYGVVLSQYSPTSPNASVQ